MSGCDADGEETPKQQEADPVPMAEGGEVAFITVSGTLYEVHTFRVPDDEAQTTSSGEQFSSELSFKRNPASGTVEVLVVAGGGGGGGSTGNTSSGGGAGRLVYHSAFNVVQEEEEGEEGEEGDSVGIITVKVGLGGAGGFSNGTTGFNGGDSVFSRHEDYQIIAKGGGGGAGNSGSAILGAAGGSSGGSHGDNTSNRPDAIEVSVPDASVFGVLNLGYGGHDFMGGGAGEDSDAANNGKGFPSSISGEPKWYSGGGYISESESIEWGAPKFADAESGTGDGGGGGWGQHAGGAGGSGVVIVRWPYE